MPSSLPVLTLRASQEDAFRRARLEAFVAQMIEHARRFFPAECDALGEEGTRGRVRGAMDEGAKHGLVTQRDACKMVNLAFELGLETLREPWATAILGDTSASPAIRILRLRADPAAGGGRGGQVGV